MHADFCTMHLADLPSMVVGMPVLVLVINKLIVAVVPLQILLRLFIIKTELKANGC